MGRGPGGPCPSSDAKPGFTAPSGGTSPAGTWPIRRHDPEEPGRSWRERGVGAPRGARCASGLRLLAVDTQAGGDGPRAAQIGMPRRRRWGGRAAAPGGLERTPPHTHTRGCGARAAASRERLVDACRQVTLLRGHEVATGGPALGAGDASLCGLRALGKPTCPGVPYLRGQTRAP